MNTAILNKAIAVIRQYGHCDTQLRNGDCFCAWGAVCEAYRQMTGLGRWVIRKEEGSLEARWYFETDNMGCSYLPPPAVEKWFGHGHDDDGPDGDNLISANSHGKGRAIKFLQSLCPL